MDEQTQGQGPMTKPKGFWKRDDVVTILKSVLDHKLLTRTAAEQMSLLGCGPVEEQKVYHYSQLLLKGKEMFDPTRNDLKRNREREAQKREFGGVNISYKDLDRAIEWGQFFGVEDMSGFDLRVVCAMFYASERIVARCATATKMTGELLDIRSQASRYITTWAERFGKYTLAACLGEFRHRAIVGPMKLVPKLPRSGHHQRAAAQRAAMLIWGDQKKVAAAAKYLTEKFADPTYFRGGSYGGKAWSNIAKTFMMWQSKTISDTVFADYVWDLSHNGGRFFDKCEMFQNEHLVRNMLNEKRASKSGTIEWGRTFLHPSWTRGLELVEIANMPAPEVD